MASFVLAIEITSIYLIYLLYKITITNVPFQMFSGFFSNISRNFSFGVNLAIVENDLHFSPLVFIDGDRFLSFPGFSRQ